MNRTHPSCHASPARSTSSAGTQDALPPNDARSRQERLRSLRDTVSAGLGAVMGVLPHVLHHVALIGSAALVAGVGGNALFFAIGLVFSLPMLRRLYRLFIPAVGAG